MGAPSAPRAIAGIPRAPEFVLWVWAFLYLTDLPIRLLGLPPLPAGLAALPAAAGLAWWVSRPSVLPARPDRWRLAHAAFALLAAAAAHDVVHALLLGNAHPSAVFRGLPAAAVWAAAAYVVAWLLGRTRRPIPRRFS